MASPGVVLSSKFVTSSSQGFASYLKYMKRSEAVRTNAYSEYNFAFDDIKARDFDQYNQYMSNPEKTSALFNENSNQLKSSELAGVVEQFQLAEKNHSLMWQHVISFDNAWLEKFGQYNQETHELNSEVVMKATRAAMTELMNREGMEGAVWTGAIHYNTDNIHVHIAMVEPTPTREKYYYKDKDGQVLIDPRTKEPVWDYKGKLSTKSFERVKSQVASAISNQSEMLKELSLVSRKQLGNKESFLLRLREDMELQTKFIALQKKLPTDRRLWKYNNSAMKEFRPLLDEITTDYLTKYQSESFNDFNSKLDEAVRFYKATYGESRYDDYKENKLNELYANLGNGLLKSISNEGNLQKNRLNNSSSNDFERRSFNHFQSQPQLSRRAVNQLKKAFDKSYDEMHNEYEYERMKREIELENKSNMKY